MEILHICTISMFKGHVSALFGLVLASFRPIYTSPAWLLCKQSELERRLNAPI